jgi:hypothetical protein
MEANGDGGRARLITTGLAEFVRERSSAMAIARHAIMQG